MKKKLLLLSPDPRYTAVLDRHPCYLACNCGFNHVQTVQCTHDVIHRALIWHLSRVLLQNFAFIICNISRIWHHRIGAFPSARRFYRASNVWITSQEGRCHVGSLSLHCFLFFDTISLHCLSLLCTLILLSLFFYSFI